MTNKPANKPADKAADKPQNKPQNKSASKIRLDAFLVQQGYFLSDKDALRAVLAHEVKVDGTYATSAAIPVAPNAHVEVRKAKQFVSRGGLKLQEALDVFKQTVEGMHCIDIGSSTGGFTDCLLQAGAASVVCVDVNYGQLAWKLRQDTRVQVFERTNIKLAEPAHLGAPFDMLVADVSFIGLASLAGVFARLCREGSVFIGLIKPQFEALAYENERGIVHDEAVRQRSVSEVKDALVSVGFEVSGVIKSPLEGAKGNVEYLVRAVYAPSRSKTSETRKRQQV